MISNSDKKMLLIFFKKEKCQFDRLFNNETSRTTSRLKLSVIKVKNFTRKTLLNHKIQIDYP